MDKSKKPSFWAGRPKWVKKFFRLCMRLAFILTVIWALFTFVGDVYIHHDNNMYPHIKDGDLAVTYKLNGYIKGQVALYEYDGKRQLGRVIAGPGDVIEMDDTSGSYLVNGLIPYENVFYNTFPAEGGVTYPYEVPEGEYFVLNDMREMMTDSRAFGAIPEEDMYGMVVFTLCHRGF